MRLSFLNLSSGPCSFFFRTASRSSAIKKHLWLLLLLLLELGLEYSLCCYQPCILQKAQDVKELRLVHRKLAPYFLRTPCPVDFHVHAQSFMAEFFLERLLGLEPIYGVHFLPGRYYSK